MSKEIISYTEDYTIENAIEWLINNIYNYNLDTSSNVRLSPKFSNTTEAIQDFKEFMVAKNSDNGLHKIGKEVEINSKKYSLTLHLNNDKPCNKCAFVNKRELCCGFPENAVRECEMLGDMHTIEYKLKK